VAPPAQIPPGTATPPGSSSRAAGVPRLPPRLPGPEHSLYYTEHRAVGQRGLKAASSGTACRFSPSVLLHCVSTDCCCWCKPRQEQPPRQGLPVAPQGCSSCRLGLLGLSTPWDAQSTEQWGREECRELVLALCASVLPHFCPTVFPPTAAAGTNRHQEVSSPAVTLRGAIVTLTGAIVTPRGAIVPGACAGTPLSPCCCLSVLSAGVLLLGPHQGAAWPRGKM